MGINRGQSVSRTLEHAKLAIKLKHSVGLKEMDTVARVGPGKRNSRIDLGFSAIGSDYFLRCQHGL